MSVGEQVGLLSQRVASLEENITPDEPVDQLQVGYNDDVVVSGNLKVYKNNISGVALVFNHVVQGDLNVFEWNGGYVGDPILVLDKDF